MNNRIGSPSPVKSRPSLPTSPTHIQAMRHATHQKQQQQQNSMNFHQQSPPTMSSQQNSPVNCGLISPAGSVNGQQTTQQQQQQQQQQNQQGAILPSMGSFEFNSGNLDLNGFCGSPG